MALSNTTTIHRLLSLCLALLSFSFFHHDGVTAVEDEGVITTTFCACGGSSSSSSVASLVLPPRPDVSAKAETARWMARVLDWGVLTTISTRLGDDNSSSDPVPFGNVYSFVDGTCSRSTGVPYVYGTYLDQSFIDIKQDPKVSLTLSEASLSSVCASKHGLDSCTLGRCTELYPLDVLKGRTNIFRFLLLLHVKRDQVRRSRKSCMWEVDVDRNAYCS